MIVFISFSGEVSARVAELLVQKIPQIVSNVIVYHSGQIKPGDDWSKSIEEKLRNSNFGIVLLTEETMSAPWIHFEAGALSKLDDACVVPILLGGIAEIGGPLGRYQAIHPTQERLLDLSHRINESKPKSDRDEKKVIEGRFKDSWNSLREELRKILDRQTPPSELSAAYKDTVQSLKDASKHVPRLETHALFATVLRREMTLMRETFKRWGKRNVRVEPERYLDYLISAYEAAQKNVFSLTPGSRYRFWKEDRYGERLFRIQTRKAKEQNINISRIFVVEGWAEVSDGLLEEVNRHAKANVQTKVLIASEGDSNILDPDFGRHFISIDDGQVLIVVHEEGTRVASADIHFDDTIRCNRLPELIAALNSRSRDPKRLRSAVDLRLERTWRGLDTAEEILRLRNRMADRLTQIPEDSILKNFARRSLARGVEEVADLSKGQFALEAYLPTDEIIQTFVDYVSQLDDTSCRYDTISISSFWKGITNNGNSYDYLIANKKAAIDGTAIRRVFVFDGREFDAQTVATDAVLSGILRQHYQVTLESDRFAGSVETRIYFSRDYDVDCSKYPNMAIWKKGFETLLFKPEVDKDNLARVEFSCYDERLLDRFDVKRHLDQIRKMQIVFEELWEKSEPLQMSHF